jgi:NAD-dependent dihydropyrimidine dehydrogenase PreA subunit
LKKYFWCYLVFWCFSGILNIPATKSPKITKENTMKEMIYLKDVVTLRLNSEKCNGCGMCVKVCPHAVFEISGGKARLTNRDKCMECGACALNCEKRAIFVNSGMGCGCATGIIEGFFNGTEPTCGGSEIKSGCC